MGDPRADIAKLADVDPVEFRCSSCSKLIFKAKALDAVVVEAKCTRCATVTEAVLPAASTAAA